MIRVLVADDHAAIRSGLQLLLDQWEDIEVVGQAQDGMVAVEQARALRPDVVLMDVRMPGLDGIEATRCIVEAGLGKVLILTSFEIDEYVTASLHAGADGYLLKTVDAEPLAHAIRRVHAGDAVLAPEVTRIVVDGFSALPRNTGVKQSHAAADLTPREQDILGALTEGMSNAEIGALLFIAESTVKTHVSRILAKLGCTTRLQAAATARRDGLVP